MSTDSQQNTHRSSALEFKSSTFSVPVLVLASNDVVIIEQQLQEKVQLAPEFFKNSPLVFDLQELNKRDVEINVAELTHIIRKLDLLPIGIRGGTAQQNQQALELGIPIHAGHNMSAASGTEKQQTPKPEAVFEPQAVSAATTTLITLPVRSGQRVYAEGDLIILAQVSAGAEILAEGNIHVYGSLRGRALAGVLGNTAARIFCSDLQAELISIAGNYKISEDLNGTVLNQPVQIYLQNHALVIKDI
ncbi:MAG: septum site-determining protein MinC [Methylobacter sp.]|nr:septum site-determining protein MinC [Methylobacter sp.]MDP2098352.1 septum site-determining protein MinC [Methylobacter sp.]MDP2430168.1 septum site-determining protein MinC [Methylobacter sp.]MDP3056353.1 septum site-determining protein MinC [Methylobacter sp.]MDP3363295.1 septum site-determining protein MinC [Methylobacter sp.]